MNRENKRKGARPRGLSTRLATPFTIRCLSCGSYIYKNKRHNAVREIAQDKDYLGVESYRFHIKCTGCGRALCIRTDPKNGVYVTESGCIRIDEEVTKQDEEKDLSVKLRKESDMKDEISKLRVQTSHVDSSSSAFNSSDKLGK